MINTNNNGTVVISRSEKLFQSFPFMHNPWHFGFFFSFSSHDSTDNITLVSFSVYIINCKLRFVRLIKRIWLLNFLHFFYLYYVYHLSIISRWSIIYFIILRSTDQLYKGCSDLPVHFGFLQPIYFYLSLYILQKRRIRRLGWWDGKERIISVCS